MASQADDFRHLDCAGRAAAGLARNPRATTNIVVGGAILLSWTVLAAMAIRAAESGIARANGPGGAMLKLLPPLPLPDFLGRFLALCLTPQVPETGILVQSGTLTAMWFLMAIAAMLPSALPMVRTYCEIADTARAKGEPAAHPLVLVAGYLAIWLAASVLFALPTLALQGFASGHVLGPVTGTAGALALALAGLYQFSGLKEACLTKCRNPFATLFANWSDRPARIFRLGAKQGVWCLGCCWALMLVMFAVGVMNLFWMALIGLFTVVEKQTVAKLPTRLAGTILLVWAAALLVVSR